MAEDLRLEDRFHIEQALLRYCRGVDRKDWDAVRAAYHPDAHDDHGNYKGGIDGFIASVIERHKTIEQSTHAISNTQIEFAGPDAALVETYFIVHQRHSPEGGDARNAFIRGRRASAEEAVENETIGRYVDQFTRRDGVWKIAKRVVVFEVYRSQAAPAGGGLLKNWVIARRDGQDAVEVARREMGVSK